MKIAVVTIAYKLPEATKKLLESIQSKKGYDIEILLYLHSDDPQVVEVCEAAAKDNTPDRKVTLFPYKVNRGLAKSWNEGMLHAYNTLGATIVLIINDDVVMGVGDVDKLADFACQHRKNYVITCGGYNHFHKKRDSIGFSCFAINPIALEKVGCFDENYWPIYYEDTDYCRRAALLGLRQAHCDETNIEHEGSATLHQGKAENHDQKFEGNKAYFIQKWGGEPHAETFNLPFNDGRYGVYIAPEHRHAPYGRYDRPNPIQDVIKLDIGCGDMKRPGYMGVDPYVVTDIRRPMWDLPFAESVVDEIFSSHSLEHVAKANVIPTLKEWARVIKPGGKIVIRVPDLIWCCEHFLKNPDDGWQLATIYGHQAHQGEFHLTGFTKAWMERYLHEAGLTLVKYEDLETHGQKTMSFEVTK